jgi:hypothetical protein
VAARLKIVRSVEEYIKEIADLREKWFPDDALVPWCRGQERSEWDLIPKLYRLTDEDALDIEHEIREEFATRAPALSDYVKLSDDPALYNWESYFAMQHYGAPTRLLDWTESSLVALYFAVRTNSGHFNAAVWALDAWWLNKKVMKADEVIPPADPGTTADDRDKLSRWLPGRFTKGKGTKLGSLPVAVFPTHNMRRISAQRSCFTIHGSDRNGFGTVVRAGKSDSLVKFEIPSWEILQIRRTLATCGIDETTIFPDLEALGRAVTANWISRRESRPHDGVYVRIQRSRTHGVGLFAIKKIEKGTKLFGGDDSGMIWIHKKSVASLPKEVKRLYTDFGVLKDGRYGCPPSFNQLTPAWYLNDSKTDPNVRCDANFDFFALRDIKSGEELTADYSTYSEVE